MYSTVKKFFAQYHHLVLPGIGNFSVQTIPAQINFTDRSISPYSSKIIFSNNELAADKKFFKFLSHELNIDEVQAIRKFTDFTASLKEKLNQEKIIHLDGIGQVIKEPSKLNFLADQSPEYLPELIAERIIRKNATHLVRVGEDERTSDEMHTALHPAQIIKKERWWIAATILAAVGIAAIIFYYTIYT